MLGPLAQTQLGGFVSKTVLFLQGTGDGEGIGRGGIGNNLGFMSEHVCIVLAEP